MKKPTLLLLLTLPFFGQAQIWDVLASGGATVEQNGYRMSYTVGEAVIWTATGNSHTAQQGFQQHDFITTGIEELASYNHQQLSIFPNPATTEIILNGLPTGNLPVSVFDAEGRNVLTALTSGNEAVQVSSLASGQYTVAVFDTENRTVYSTSLIKTNP